MLLTKEKPKTGGKVITGCDSLVINMVTSVARETLDANVKQTTVRAKRGKPHLNAGDIRG
jgi:hypothetical protein